LTHFQRLFAYDAWANRHVLASLAGGGPDAALRLFSHLLVAARVWHGRIMISRGAVIELPSDIFPLYTLTTLNELVEEYAAAWPQLLATVHPTGWNEPVRYCTLRGISHASQLHEILIQVTNHSTYHRAQIACELRQVGLTPAQTDYISYTRELHDHV
jgi:uncharacterized damage-inducible protein DinB